MASASEINTVKYDNTIKQRRSIRTRPEQPGGVWASGFIELSIKCLLTDSRIHNHMCHDCSGPHIRLNTRVLLSKISHFLQCVYTITQQIRAGEIIRHMTGSNFGFIRDEECENECDWDAGGVSKMCRKPCLLPGGQEPTQMFFKVQWSTTWTPARSWEELQLSPTLVWDLEEHLWPGLRRTFMAAPAQTSGSTTRKFGN